MRTRISTCLQAVALVTFMATTAQLVEPAAAETCVRLPLSDVAFGKPAATAAAREKLSEYAAEKLKQRGWSGTGPVKSSNEKVTCEVYLELGPLGTEYRCLVTATYCAK